MAVSAPGVRTFRVALPQPAGTRSASCSCVRRSLVTLTSCVSTVTRSPRLRPPVHSRSRPPDATARCPVPGAGPVRPRLADRATTIEQWVQDTVAVLDAGGTARVHVLANGDTALVALLLAATHPDRVATLTLVNGYARLTSLICGCGPSMTGCASRGNRSCPLAWRWRTSCYPGGRRRNDHPGVHPRVLRPDAPAGKERVVAASAVGLAAAGHQAVIITADRRAPAHYGSTRLVTGISETEYEHPQAGQDLAEAHRARLRDRHRVG